MWRTYIGEENEFFLCASEEEARKLIISLNRGGYYITPKQETIGGDDYWFVEPYAQLWNDYEYVVTYKDERIRLYKEEIEIRKLLKKIEKRGKKVFEKIEKIKREKKEKRKNVEIIDFDKKGYRVDGGLIGRGSKADDEMKRLGKCPKLLSEI